MKATIDLKRKILNLKFCAKKWDSATFQKHFLERYIQGFLVIALLLVLTTVGPLPDLEAQSQHGTIKGVVKDTTGVFIPGVRVRVRNLGTNWQREAPTNWSGQYNISNLNPGNYEVSAELEGFKKWTSTLTLHALQTAVVDIMLEVGEVTTTIEVADSTLVINVQDSALGDIKKSERIRQLPLNGRDLANLFTLTPGVELAPGYRSGAIQANGLRIGSAQYLIDGAPLEDKYLGSIVRVRPNLDAVQEFRIETNGSSAEFSKPVTASFVTKSGTNEWHGAVFETHRNNALRAQPRRS